MPLACDLLSISSDKQVDESFLPLSGTKSFLDNLIDAIFIADLSDHKIIESKHVLRLFVLEAGADLRRRKIQALMKNPYNTQGLEEINTRLINDGKWSWERNVPKINGSLGQHGLYLLLNMENNSSSCAYNRYTEIRNSNKTDFEKERAESATIAKAHFSTI
ncbi:hypothetical protein [Okeania hirsuta]|uniref:hypothetical protein n=1 Tax=Okeania hirsuta TaxID=1458930 RepID=UPI000F5233D4|nr:hypothetical protein [Okeania hirsuta]